MTVVGGIDGCRTGWFLIAWDGHRYTHGAYATLAGLMNENPGLQRVFIDMPMGLGSATTPRMIEKMLRRELPGRASTVFNVPVREAVYQPGDAEAKRENVRIEGKSISIQSLNIRRKIRELDTLIRRGHLHTEIIESHPELCFKYLNGGQVLTSRKSLKAGIEHRLKILARHDGALVPEIRNAFNEYSLNAVRRDDIVAAAGLCLAIRYCIPSGISYLEQEPPEDDHGIPIRIGYFNPFARSSE